MHVMCPSCHKVSSAEEWTLYGFTVRFAELSQHWKLIPDAQPPILVTRAKCPVCNEILSVGPVTVSHNTEAAITKNEVLRSVMALRRGF